MRIDLNADLGEGLGAYSMGDDGALMSSISSANVACGFHAGDPTVMRRTIRLVRDAGVALGAHPGFPDLAGFGRREMHLASAEVEDLVLYQVAALAGVAAAEGVPLHHVKAHGALYNMAARDGGLAGAIAAAVRAFDESLVVFGLPGSAMLEAARGAGLAVAAEGFADRAYRPDGSLAPRGTPGAVIRDPVEVVERALRMVQDCTVTTTDGSVLRLEVDTICVHGDTPGAADLASALRRGLAQAGVAVAPIERP